MQNGRRITILFALAAVLLAVGGGRALWTGRSEEFGGTTALADAEPARTDASVPARASDISSERRAPFQVDLRRDGTFALLYRQRPLVNAAFRFWEANWKWAGAIAERGDLRDGSASLKVRIPKLDAQLAGTIAVESANVLTYDLTVERHHARKDVKGGGLEFVLDLDSPLFAGGTAPNPELLADGAGWEWPLGSGRTVKVTFEPRAERVFFENNNKGRIRAFFLGESFEAGRSQVRVTVALPQETVRKPTQSEEYGPDEPSGWVRNAFPYPHAPVDLSGLNHVPGKHGPLRAEGDRLVFEDGTPARFWGINVMAYALFSQDQQIALHARRLAMLGFNLVRLHHHDTTAWVSPTVIDKHTRDSRSLDERGIDRVDYWIKCLRENGIYVWLDLHSYRQFREGDRSTDLGDVATFDEFSRDKQPREVKGYCQYDPVLQKLMIEFQQRYLSHVNRYTGVAYKDDPAIAFVLVTNENDITHHYGVRAIPRAGHPELTRLFNERTRIFAEKTSLPQNAVRQPWSPGPAQLFLNDQEHAFCSTMIGGIRGTGSRALVAAGNLWGDNPISSLPALTTGDIIDVHQYSGPGSLTDDPRYKANIASSIGINQIADMPLTVSEWNLVQSQELAVDRFVAPLYMASIAALQGWDALMMYGYSQQTLVPQLPVVGVWDAINDPGLMAMMPAAALLYRQGHVAAGRKEYQLALSPQQLFGPPIRPDSCAAARTLMEQSRFALAIPQVPELDWLKPTKPSATAVRVESPTRCFLPDDARSVTSDTGEIVRDWEAGVQTINAPKTQAAQGAIGGRDVRLPDVALRIETKHAAVAVSSLDDRPLRSSERILVTAVARVLKPKRQPGKGRGRSEPMVFSEPVRGEIAVAAPPGLEVYVLNSAGKEFRLPESTYVQGRYRIPLDKTFSHWYLLHKPASPQ